MAFAGRSDHSAAAQGLILARDSLSSAHFRGKGADAIGSMRILFAAIQAEMSKDAQAQRQVCINLVGEAISRNNKYIDKTLQLSNLPALTGYLFGSSKGASGMPVASSSWEAEVVSGTFDQLAKQVGQDVCY
jgi:hypothetical protein